MSLRHRSDTAQQFMERLVAEKRFGDVQADGWHYPPIRKLRRHRPRRKPMAANKPKTEESIADEPEPVDLAGRIDELEQEGHTLRARIKRLQDAGKTVIAQREHWKSRALAAEQLLEAERPGMPAVRIASTRCADWLRRNCILTSARAVSLRN